MERKIKTFEYVATFVTLVPKNVGGDAVEDYNEKQFTFVIDELDRLDNRITEIVFRMMDVFQVAKDIGGEKTFRANAQALVPIINDVIDTLFHAETPLEKLSLHEFKNDKIAIGQFAEFYANNKLFPFFLIFKNLLPKSEAKTQEAS